MRSTISRLVLAACLGLTAGTAAFAQATGDSPYFRLGPAWQVNGGGGGSGGGDPPTGNASAFIGYTPYFYNVRVGTPIVAIPNVMGFTATPTFRVYGGAIPSGMQIDPVTGVIAGTPDAAGSWQAIGIEAYDGADSATASMNITASANPDITYQTPWTVTAGSTVSIPATVNGILGTASYSVVGAPPPGVTVDTTTGLISGSINTQGSWSFTVRVTDSFDGTTDVSNAVSIQTAVVSASASSAVGQVGKPITIPVTCSNISSPTVSLVSGTLPTGLQIVGSAITGTPTQVTAAGGVSLVFACSNGPVHANTPAFTVTIKDPKIVVGSAFTFSQGTTGTIQPSTTGMRSPITWSIGQGTAPTDMTLAPSTGVLSGKMNSAKTWPAFQYHAVDADGLTADSQDVVVTVNGAIAVSDITGWQLGYNVTKTFSTNLTYQDGWRFTMDPTSTPLPAGIAMLRAPSLAPVSDPLSIAAGAPAIWGWAMTSGTTSGHRVLATNVKTGEQVVSQDFSISIAPAIGSIAMDTPDQGVIVYASKTVWNTNRWQYLSLSSSDPLYGTLPGFGFSGSQGGKRNAWVRQYQQADSYGMIKDESCAPWWQLNGCSGFQDGAYGISMTFSQGDTPGVYPINLMVADTRETGATGRVAFWPLTVKIFDANPPKRTYVTAFYVDGVARGANFSTTLAAGHSVEERLSGETFIQSVGLRCSLAQNFASSPLVVRVDTLLPDGTNYSPGTFTITDSCQANGEVTLPIRNSVTDRVVLTILSGQIAANNVRSYAFDCMYPNWPSAGSCEIN